MGELSDDVRRIVMEVVKGFDLQALLRDAYDARGDARKGIFPDVDGAVKAAAAQRELISLPLGARRGIIEAREPAGPSSPWMRCRRGSGTACSSWMKADPPAHCTGEQDHGHGKRRE